MKTSSLIIFILASFFINVAGAQNSTMKVNLVTGGDDLRGGNFAYITVNYTDGTTSAEYNIGGGFANGSSNTKDFPLNRALGSIAEVKNILLRHDGKPRAGNPFDTYDNWDLKSIKVTFTIAGEQLSCINLSGNPLQRFTGNVRNKTYANDCGGPAPGGTNSVIKVYLTTGSDDLRGGNQAYITLKFKNGLKSDRFSLGGGFQQNTANKIRIDTKRIIGDVKEVESITITHDGSPRPGYPVDTYDNWDLQVLRVALVMPNQSEQNIINVSGNPVFRFTGQNRSRIFNR
ncbi:MAG: hypothetical protein ACOYOA_14110 [Saprospiraceae bacterium]